MNELTLKLTIIHIHILFTLPSGLIELTLKLTIIHIHILTYFTKCFDIFPHATGDFLIEEHFSKAHQNLNG